MDRVFELRMANAFFEGYLGGNPNELMAEMVKTAKSSMEFELETMAPEFYATDTNCDKGQALYPEPFNPYDLCSY